MHFEDTNYRIIRIHNTLCNSLVSSAFLPQKMILGPVLLTSRIHFQNKVPYDLGSTILELLSCDLNSVTAFMISTSWVAITIRYSSCHCFSQYPHWKANCFKPPSHTMLRETVVNMYLLVCVCPCKLYRNIQLHYFRTF